VFRLKQTEEVVRLPGATIQCDRESLRKPLYG
jgi:hypothetical protein